jgi:hypothetical protein
VGVIVSECVYHQLGAAGATVLCSAVHAQCAVLCAVSVYVCSGVNDGGSCEWVAAGSRYAAGY